MTTSWLMALWMVIMNNPGDIRVYNLISRGVFGNWSYYDNSCGVIREAVNAFGHLIEYGKDVTNAQFAELIKHHYDVGNPKTKCIVDSLTKEITV